MTVSDPLRAVLVAMQHDAAHLALVHDESGAQVGVAALEDVIEELVGEVRDEVRVPNRPNPGEVRGSGR